MRLKYIEGFWPPPAPAAHAGIAFHKTTELDNKTKFTDQEPLSLVALQHTFAIEYTSNLELKGVALSKAGKVNKKAILNQFLQRGLRALEIYHEQAKTVVPLEIEQEYLVDVGYPLPVKGFIDLLVADDIIIDYKLTKAKNKDFAASSLQGLVYSFLYYRKHGKIPTVRFVIFSDRKKDPLVELNVKHTEQKINTLLRYIESFWQDLEQDIFRPANPTDWICSEKWCAFYGACKYTQTEEGKYGRV